VLDFAKKVGGQILEFLKGLSPGKKIAMGVTGVAIGIGIITLFMWAGQTTYQPLMSNLSAEDASNIMRMLRDKHIPFKVDPSGKNISVPPEGMYDLRLELASMGLPQSSVVGYEVFDKESFGTTSFVQKLNQKRALEGELVRSINTIKGVKRSRVHLALPQKSTFVEDQKKASASVVLDLEAGTTLGEKQVYGIGNLVARAVEGLDVPDVVIVDNEGRVLSKNNNDPLSVATASHLDFQQKIEHDYEKRIETMLSHVVGEGHVVAKVSAEIDFSSSNETQTTYDADGGAIRSVEKRNDSMNGVRPAPYGAAGAVSNTPGQQTAANVGEVKNETVKTNEVMNYEVPQTVRHTTHPSGSVKKLSVAVMVDGKTTKTAQKDGTILAKVDPWPPEKLKEFEDVVASSVGLDRKRGDLLEIKNIEFSKEDFEEAQKIIAEKERKSYVQALVLYSVIGITIALFFFFVVRPFIKWVTENTIDSVDTFLPQTIEELERLQKNATLPGLEETIPVLPERIDPEKIEGEMIKEKIITLVDTNPHKAALILKDWLHGEKKLAKSEDTADGGKTA